MSSPEAFPTPEDPALAEIITLYGDVPLRNHQGHPQPLRQAIEECPPFAHALLRAESPEEVKQIIEVFRIPE
ncbi:hypothetical protein HY379_01885 [Candidatus Saccharibacteria bacterium]|nr:hypothetical protein [Candidatus Saccharibacteria bacterium]HLG91051.1 hypothetical protein [Candidatus Saccharimonadales bacterium]